MSDVIKNAFEYALLASQRSPQGLREKHSLKQEAVALPLCKTRVITRATTLSNDENTHHRSKHNH